MFFDIIDEQVTDIFECKDGVRVTGYRSQFVPRNEHDHCINHALLLVKIMILMIISVSISVVYWSFYNVDERKKTLYKQLES